MKKIVIGLLSLFCILSVAAQDKTVQEMRNEANRTIKKIPMIPFRKFGKQEGFSGLLLPRVHRVIGLREAIKVHWG